MVNVFTDANCKGSSSAGIYTSGLKVSEYHLPTDNPDYFAVWTSTGTQISNFHWGPNEPDHVFQGQAEDCIGLWVHTVPLEWNDLRCGTARCYMCEQKIPV